MLTVSRKVLALVTVFLLMGVLGVFLFANFSLDDKGVMAQDSIDYRYLAAQECDSPIHPIINGVIENESLIALNWATIITVGSVACSISESYRDVLILLFNLMTLVIFLFVYGNILDRARVNKTDQYKIILFLLPQLFLICSLPSLNKEVISYLAINLLALGYIKKSIWLLILTGIFTGLVKVQFFLFALMLLASLAGVGFWVQLATAAAAMTILYDRLPIFDLTQFYQSYEANVRSEALTLTLDQILKYPMGFVLVMPIRTLLNLLAGFSPERIAAMNSTWIAFSYQVNAVFLAIVSFALMGKLATKRLLPSVPLAEFFFLYCIMLASLPYLQTRYFLPMLPIMLVAIYSPSGLAVQQHRLFRNGVAIIN